MFSINQNKAEGRVCRRGILWRAHVYFWKIKFLQPLYRVSVSYVFGWFYEAVLRSLDDLKYFFSIPVYITKKFIEIPPCPKKVIFSTEFVLLDPNPHFYEVNQEV